MKLWLKIVLGMIGVIIIAAGGAFAYTQTAGRVDPANIPQFIQADFVDLSRITSISKFRSGEGHDFSSGGETCRSMKHYFTPPYDAEDDNYRQAHNGIPTPPDPATAIPIYSPVDGVITSIQEEHTPIGRQVYIRPNGAKQFTVRLFHIFLKDGVTKGMHVTAGQQIGTIAKAQGTDIAIEAGFGPKQTLVSYFQVMPDTIFAAYQNRGATSRDDFIVTKEYRDAHPFQCNGEMFAQQSDGSSDDVHLSGYESPQKMYDQQHPQSPGN